MNRKSKMVRTIWSWSFVILGVAMMTSFIACNSASSSSSDTKSVDSAQAVDSTQAADSTQAVDSTQSVTNTDGFNSTTGTESTNAADSRQYCYRNIRGQVICEERNPYRPSEISGGGENVLTPTSPPRCRGCPRGY